MSEGSAGWATEGGHRRPGPVLDNVDTKANKVVEVLVDEEGNEVVLEERRHANAVSPPVGPGRSEEHTSELQSQHLISYAVFCLKKIFFNDTATTEIYTLSLHDALPISRGFGR